MVEKWKRVRENPHSCAALLEAIKVAILDVLFGFKPGDKRQSDPGCYCGVVLAVVAKVEQSGRLSLHIHGGAILAAFCVERLRELFAGPNCKALAIASSLCSQWQQPPFYNRLPSGDPNCVHNWTAAESRARGVAPPVDDRRCPAAGYNFLTMAGATPVQHKAAAARAATAAAVQQQPSAVGPFGSTSTAAAPPLSVAGSGAAGQSRHAGASSSAPATAQPAATAENSTPARPSIAAGSSGPTTAAPPDLAGDGAAAQLPASAGGADARVAQPSAVAEDGDAAQPLYSVRLARMPARRRRVPSTFTRVPLATPRAEGLPALPDRERLCCKHCAKVVASTLTHTHSTTCVRHGCLGTDEDCGMIFPRELREFFRWLGNEGSFLLARSGTMQVRWCVVGVCVRLPCPYYAAPFGRRRRKRV